MAAHKLLMLKITVIKYMLNKPWILREALRSKPQIKKNKPIAEIKRLVCKYEAFVLVSSAEPRLRWLLSSRAAWDSSHLSVFTVPLVSEDRRAKGEMIMDESVGK